jgi:hypothetical protein
MAKSALWAPAPKQKVTFVEREGPGWTVSLDMRVTQTVRFVGVADRHAQAGQQPFGRTATRGMAEQPHDPSHARAAACERGREIHSSLGKSPALALIIEATPSGHPGLDNNRRPLRRQILKRPDIRAMPRTGPRTMAGPAATIITPAYPPVFVIAQPDAVPGRKVVTKPRVGRC